MTAPGPTYAITSGALNALGGSAAGNYSTSGALSVANSPTLTITQAPVTATITTPGQTKVYGTNDPALPGLTLGGVVNGVNVTDWNLAVTAINDAGNVTQTLSSLTRASGETVTAPGPTYAITSGALNALGGSAAGNYSTSGALSVANSPTLTITQAPVTATITTPGQTKVYGTNDPALPGLTLGGVVNGVNVTDWNLAVTAINDAGNVTQTLSSLTRASGETVTAPGPTYAITSGALNALGGSAAGNYSTSGALSVANSPTLTITQAPVTATITTPGQTKVYGTNDPALPGLTLGGVVNGVNVTDWNLAVTAINDAGNVTQTLSSLTRASGETVTAPGPTYAITSGALNALGGSAAGNYSTSGALSVANSPTLTITQAPVTATITTPGQTKVYGTNDPALPGLTLGGVVNGVNVTDWNLAVTAINDAGNVTQTLSSLTRASGETVTAPGPTYAITSGALNALGGSAAGNYSTSGALSVANSPTLTITQAPVTATITTPGQTKVYGTNDPALPGLTLGGVVNGVNVTDWNLAVTAINDAGNVTQTLSSLTRASGETVTAPGPTYAITSGALNALGGSAAGNYSTSGALSVANSPTLTITQAPVTATITTPGQTKVYGTNDPALPGLTLGGVVNGVNVTDWNLAVTAINDAGNVTQTLSSLTRASGETVTAPGPTYAITSGALNALGGSAAGNYSTSGALSVANSPTLTITQAPVTATITTPGQTKVYGTNDPALPGLTLGGVVNGVNVTDWNLAVTAINDAGNVTQTLSSLTRASGETVTAPGPTYAITSGALNALGGSAAGNYSTSGALSVANSPTLTITQAPVTATITTPGQTKVYGTNDPALPGLTLGGVVNGVNVTDWNLAVTAINDAGNVTQTLSSLTRASGETVTAPGPTYAITSGALNALGGSAAGNYSTSGALSVANSLTLTITQAPVTATITTPGQTKVYGTNDPALPGLTLGGVVNGVNVTDWNLAVTAINDAGNVTQTLSSLTRASGETVTAPGPTYAITSGALNALGGSAAGNYWTSGALSVANSPTLTITQAPVTATITTPGQTKVYGTNDPALPGLTLGGVVNGVNVTDWNLAVTAINDAGNVTQTLSSLTRASGETVTAPGPTYAITSGALNALGGSAAGNYSTSGALSVANSLTLTITQAAGDGDDYDAGADKGVRHERSGAAGADARRGGERRERHRLEPRRHGDQRRGQRDADALEPHARLG